MKYDVYLSPRAKKQYKRFDAHIRHKIRTGLLELEEDPSEKGSLLQGFTLGLRYIKIFHAGIQYRAVYDMAKAKKEVLVIFIGSRENFYKELRRFLV
ncbi:MAG: type II toxin-antitoxin system RelE family toxin [Desulfobacterales bacterium]